MRFLWLLYFSNFIELMLSIKMIEILTAIAVEKGVELFTAGVGLGVSTYLGLKNKK